MDFSGLANFILHFSKDEWIVLGLVIIFTVASIIRLFVEVTGRFKYIVMIILCLLFGYCYLFVIE